MWLDADRFDGSNQLRNVVFPASVCQLVNLTPRQGAEDVGELVFGGDVGSAHQHRDDSDVALQSGGNLEAHEVPGVVQPAIAPDICLSDPIRPDDGNEHLAGTHGLLNGFDEVHTRFDVVDVAEALPDAEVLDQLVGDASAVTRALAAASIADEDSGMVFVSPGSKVSAKSRDEICHKRLDLIARLRSPVRTCAYREQPRCQSDRGVDEDADNVQ